MISERNIPLATLVVFLVLLPLLFVSAAPMRIDDAARRADD